MSRPDEVNTVNGYPIGVRTGTALQDAEDPTNDGYDHLRNTERVGTSLQDALIPDENPTPEE